MSYQPTGGEVPHHICPACAHVVLSSIPTPLVEFCFDAGTNKNARVLASPDIPITSFSCSGRPIGYYADVENNCKTYHMCGEKGQMYSYACPNTTLFHQRMLICAHWYQVNCNRSAGDYSANLLIGQRDKPFVDDITANELNGVQTGESLQDLDGRSGKSFAPSDNINSARPTQVTYSSQVPHQDLVEAPSGSFFEGRPSTDIMPPFDDLRPPLDELVQHSTSRSTSVTEPTGAVFRPTNVSFRSTIETPNSEAVLARTAPMTSAQPFGRTESAFKASPETVTTVAPQRPSFELLPPLDTSIEETNTIELHLHDPRRVHYISKDGEIPRDEPIIVSINLPGKSRFRPQSPFARTETRSCPRCHPVFIVDRINCSPCLLVS